jgi:sortase A
VLIATGLLMFGFVAYQLWGTGLETARAQRALENEFEQLLAGTTTTAPTTTSTSPPTTTVPEEEPEEPEETTPPVTEPPGVDQGITGLLPGDPVALLEMPTIDASHVVVAGVGVAELQQGPGHFPDTPLPGQLGNASIAGHRTTYGQPFRNVDRLQPGDPIVVTTLAGRFVYVVEGTEIVAPSDTWVIATEDPDVATLTLVSCHPAFSAAQRIVVRAAFVAEESAPVGRPSPYGEATTSLPEEPVTSSAPETVPETVPPTEPTETTTPDSTATDSTATETTVAETTASTAPPSTAPPTTVSPTTPGESGGGFDESDDAFARGWFHDRSAIPQVALWGAIVSAIAVLAYLVSRRTRHDLIGIAVGIVPFTVALFFFFQNVNRLLPPGL